MKIINIIKHFSNLGLFIITLFLLFLFLSCSEDKQNLTSEKILVKIGDKSISVREFLRRAEYTVRPPYCNGDFSHEKKIILNSLIAEKLMSIEGGENNEFINDRKIELYLRGIKEQTMRQWLFEKDALGKVKIDTGYIKNTYKVVGRKYNVSYFNLNDSASAKIIRDEIAEDSKSFENAYSEKYGGEHVPKREVVWDSYENKLVLDSLFSKPLKKGQFVGPIKIGDDQFLMIKINSWLNSPAISETQVQERWNNITEQFSKWEAEKKYGDIIYEVMKGKKLEFNPETFLKVVELMKPIYLRSAAETKEYMKDSFSGKKSEMEKYKGLNSNLESFANEQLYRIDNKIWTIKDFSEELIAHPLVFRNKNENNFAQKVKLAIVDMVRDKYLAEEAYKRGYDKADPVQRTINMWRDNLNFEYYKMQLLSSTVSKNDSGMAPILLIEKYLNPVVDSFQLKYSDDIELDVEEFNKIKLTRVDMEVVRQNVPFSRVVPLFPLVTTDSKLDYGKIMKKER